MVEVQKGIAGATKAIGEINTAIKDLGAKQQSSQKLFDAANGKFKSIEKKFNDAHFK